MTGNGGRREAAAASLKSAGYPDSVPTSGGRPVALGPFKENASRRMEDISAGPGGKATIAEPNQDFADGGRARTSGATASSPLSGASEEFKRGGRAKSHRRHRAPRIVAPPMPPPDDAAAPAMADAGPGGPPPMAGGAAAAPPMGAPPMPGQQPFKSGGKAQPGIGHTNKNNPGFGAGGGMGRLRKAGLR